ncbi:molybdopterin synthase sulfur carrier subunit [Atopomonas hussainii]|uniref:Molybdopterin synthase sulfur carrier subunit n=1 Tax=Atopomonas hussainii TaxID=1429083 RepID=A0A1H7SZI9_9GAMM|nr:MoaD/ThiS family protein [Atopomonas hussainii]SEL77725.1 molybdopterin synthase sulfur carrier subunit [Atopomonas hussainii]
MLNVKYFARYRETLGSDGEQLPWQTEWQTLADVRDALLARGGAWQVLAESSLMCAVNQELVSLETSCADGDEVAFFPTVTGG